MIPETTWPHEQPLFLEEGMVLFRKPCEFVKSCVALAHLPESDFMEVAFVGRSNVGKSSLINALTNQQGLARASNTPGRTQEINFFNLGEQMHLVDLPGYGYASAPKKKVLTWQALIRAYLRGRPQLRRVFVLVDSRHGLKTLDLDIFRLLDEAAVSYQVILTKTDKISAPFLEKVRLDTTQRLERFIAAYPVVHDTSVLKKKGMEAVRAEIAFLLKN